MLQKIRDGSKGWWSYVVVPIFVLLFAFWGIGNYLTGNMSQTQIAKVNGAPLSYNTFENIYLQANHQNNPGQNPAIASSIKLQILQNLVNQELVYQALYGLGMRVNSNVIDNLIAQTPAFQEQGQFSVDKYQSFLHQMGMNTETVRQDLRKTYLITQFQGALLSSQFSLPSERVYENNLLNLVRDVNYIVIDPARFASEVTVSDKDVLHYYETHPTEFMSPYQFKLQCITLSAQQFQSPAAFQNAVNTLGDISFQDPSSLSSAARALHVQVQTTSWLSTADPSGLLKEPKVYNAVMGDAVLNQGENSPVLMINNHEAMVLRIADKKVPLLKPLNEVQGQIKQQLMTQKEFDVATQFAKKWQTALQQGQSWASVAHNAQFSLQSLTAVNVRSALDKNLLLIVGQAPAKQVLITPMNNKIFLFEVTRVYSSPHPQSLISDQAIMGVWANIESESFLSHLQLRARVKFNNKLLNAN